MAFFHIFIVVQFNDQALLFDMSESLGQETRVPPLSRESFLDLCRDGSLSRADATSIIGAQDPSTRSCGLSKAVKNGHFNAVRYLLEFEPSIEFDSTVANDAARGGLPMYRLLHSKHADMIHWTFDTQGNAVHIAVRVKDTDLLTYILDNGGDPGRTPECDRYYHIYTPIENAALVDNEDAAKVLVTNGATFKYTEALNIAVSLGHLNLVRCLIDLGADVNYLRRLEDPDWDTCFQCTGPLHVAAKNSHLEMVKLLLAHGADPTLQDMNGKTAVDMATKAGHNGVLDLLQEVALDTYFRHGGFCLIQ